MQEAEKSNVVQIRDYAPRRAIVTANRASDAAQPGQLVAWPRSSVPYPGGIDDLPV